MSCTISLPPPLSATTRNVKPRPDVRSYGRVKTSRYNRWIADNVDLVALAAKEGRGVHGPYALHLRLGKPDYRRRDLANLEKAISDLLVRCGAVRDDSDCQRLTMEWTSDLDGVFLTVVPTRLVPARTKAPK